MTAARKSVFQSVHQARVSVTPWAPGRVSATLGGQEKHVKSLRAASAFMAHASMGHVAVSLAGREMLATGLSVRTHAVDTAHA
jgi:hypothetical protein